jgi:uncharacterized metal-binding protein YceD (DUF177 family)
MTRIPHSKPDPWSVPIKVEDVPETGGHYKLSADAAARAAITTVADLRDLERFDAVFDVVRQGAAVQVTGTISAKVTQACVVSLEPIENEVSENVDLLFAPAGEIAEKSVGPRRSKKGDDPPEPLVNGVIDLAAVATEFLILGLDPYPRKPGAQFAAPAIEDGADNPFAALADLKKRSGNDLK